MDYRPLPGTDLRVSRLSLGTMTFGGQTDEAVAARMVDRALDAGINFLDTANAYNQGRSEEFLGRILRGRREKIILGTKVFNRMGDAADDRGLSRAAMLKAIEASLKRLQTDWVDLYYLHQPDWETPIEETLETMEELVRAGKVRYPAVSNYAAWQVCEILCLCEKRGWKPSRISQPMYNLLARGIEEEYLAFSKRFGVAIIPYNPLAGGLLTGKHRRAQGPISGTRFDGNRMYLDRYWHDDYFAAVEDLEVIAREAGLTLVELASRWLLSQPVVGSVILGASRVEQLDENLKACEGGPLDEATLKRCDDVWRRLRGITPKYNR